MKGATQMPTPLQSRQQQHQSPLNSRMSADKLNFPQRGHATCDLDSYPSFGPPGVLSLLLAYSTDEKLQSNAEHSCGHLMLLLLLHLVGLA